MRNKRLLQSIIVSLAVFIFFNTYNQNQAKAANSFSDVTMYSSQINYLYNKGIIKGYSDGTFRPKAPIKRLQAVEMILKQLGITNYDAPQVSFTDLKSGDYGYNQVAKAVQLGIIKGKKDGSFDPWGYLTRAQMAVIMSNTYHLKSQQPANFKDIPTNFWAAPFINALASNGITSGFQDNTYRPNQDIQRDHFSVFLMNYINHDQTVQMTNDLKGVISKEQSVVMIYGNDENNKPIQEGSGFFVGSGLILTNYHVLQGAHSFDIITNDHNTYHADGVVKYDKNLDLAILKVSTPLNIPALKLGSEQTASQGDPIVTIGSPEGLMNTVSEGIISGLRQMTNDQGDKVKLIQITAPITHGSSGGPLLDMNGFVLGVNSYGYDTGNLNFSIPIDYAKSWIDSLNKLPLSQITTVPISDISSPATSSNSSTSGTNPYMPAPSDGAKASETTVINFADPIHHVIASPSDATIYGIGNNNDVIQVNFATKQVKKIDFSLMPSSLFLEKRHLYIGLQTKEHSPYWWTADQTGAIASIDTTDFSLKNQFNIKLDPFDIVADDSHIYVSSGSGQFSNFNSYDALTGTKTASLSNVEAGLYMEMDPNQSQIYTIDTNSSPRSMSVYKISDGQFTANYGSPYWGDYTLEKKMTISPDGKYLFNASGNVFYASDAKDSNMTYVGVLSSKYTDISFDLANNRFYTVEGNTLYAYDYNTFNLLGQYQVTNSIQKLVVNNGQLYAVAIVPGNKPSYIFEKIGF